MSYAFKEMTIYMLDIHPTPALLDKNYEAYIKKDFAFLTDPGTYKSHYSAHQKMLTDNFTFEPLSDHDLKKNHFWKSYLQIWEDNGVYDYWKLQAPFTTSAIKPTIEMNISVPDVVITIYPKIYLSTAGWSTNLKIHVRGSATKSSLIKLLGQVLKGDNNVPPFKIDGVPKDRKDVFRYFNDLVINEVYDTQHPPHSGMKIIRHVVVSLNRYEGEVVPYREMPSDEKALMLSLLFGEEIDPTQMKEKEQKSPITRTYITGDEKNFALSNYDHGSLIFLQKEARVSSGGSNKSRISKGKVRCFAANVKNCIMQSFLLWQFYQSAKENGTNTGVLELKKTSKATLKGIPQEFTNVYCKNLFLQHSTLKKLVI